MHSRRQRARVSYRCAFAALSWLWTISLASAHLQPTTLVALDIGTDCVAMKLHVPLPELELAFGHGVTQDSETNFAVWEHPFREYLLEHIRPFTVSGQPWTVQVLGMSLENAVQTQSGAFQEVTVRLALLPPRGATVRDFDIKYDVIMHQVVTHKALVSIQGDWSSGIVDPVQVGKIVVDTGTGKIEPLRIHLGTGSWWQGFKAMVNLGMQHIREGTDHLLFILVLLLPATLKSAGSRWGSYAGSRNSLTCLIRIITAFTMGHSITLLAGALHWVRLPQQPVEVLIAFSILITSVHAIRPIFPGREYQIAAGFGLVHGLAFAAVLADLNLSAGPMALSILGFNLGIELMQLFVVLLTIPWLILLSQTSVHPWVRGGGAVLAGIASIGWMANRISGQTNVVERWTAGMTALAPLGILLLAFTAAVAWLLKMRHSSQFSLKESI